MPEIDFEKIRLDALNTVIDPNPQTGADQLVAEIAKLSSIIAKEMLIAYDQQRRQSE